MPISFKEVFFVCCFSFKKGLIHIHTIKFDLKTKKRTRLLQCCKGAHVFLGGVLVLHFFFGVLTHS